jgi:hypothetical protein
MPILKLSSEEVSLLKMCVALVLGGVFQDKIEAEKISNIFKNDPRRLEALFSKLEHTGQKKKPEKQSEAAGDSRATLMEHTG